MPPARQNTPSQALVAGALLVSLSAGAFATQTTGDTAELATPAPTASTAPTAYGEVRFAGTPAVGTDFLSTVRASRSGRRIAATVRAHQVAAAAQAKQAAERQRREAAAEKRRRAIAAHKARWVRPAQGQLSSTFKFRWGRMHKGIDVAGPVGTPIYAAARGVIIEAGAANGFGRVVKIRHDDGTVTLYGHMSRIVKHSGVVEAGDVIALMGNAGASTGSHLHFEVHRGGKPVNPLPWMRAHSVRI